MVNQNQNGPDLSKVSWLEINEHQYGQRIDNFLFRILKSVPKSRIYRILRKGEVRVNRSRVKPEYKLQQGDRVRIPPIRVSQEQGRELHIPAWIKRALENPLYIDDSLVVYNKPAGLAVHGGSGIEFGLIEALRQMHPHWPFLELVHRIDRETSGCILLARSRPVLNRLHQQFRREEGKLEKSYLALLSGQLQTPCTVDHPLLQTRDDRGMKTVIVDAEGQKAKSTFLPVEQFEQASYTRILLYTGRMHQARVHAASLGLPVLGDRLYGDREINRRARSMGVKRCMLHAERYQLQHPVSEKLVQFNAPLPEDFKLVLTRYREILSSSPSSA